MNHSISTKTTSIGIQTEAETWNDKTDCQLTSSLYNSEFDIEEFEQ